MKNTVYCIFDLGCLQVYNIPPVLVSIPTDLGHCWLVSVDLSSGKVIFACGRR